MDEIQITDLSSRVLNAMRARNLKAKPITEFERYGLRRILLHFSEHEWIAYSKEAVWAFVLQERLRVARHSLDSATDKIFPHISHSSSSPHDHAVFCLVLRASVLSLCFLHHCNLIINFFNLPFKAQDCLFFKLSQQQKLLLFGQSPAF